MKSLLNTKKVKRFSYLNVYNEILMSLEFSKAMKPSQEDFKTFKLKIEKFVNFFLYQNPAIFLSNKYF